MQHLPLVCSAVATSLQRFLTVSCLEQYIRTDLSLDYRKDQWDIPDRLRCTGISPTGLQGCSSSTSSCFLATQRRHIDFCRFRSRSPWIGSGRILKIISTNVERKERRLLTGRIVASSVLAGAVCLCDAATLSHAVRSQQADTYYGRPERHVSR